MSFLRMFCVLLAVAGMAAAQTSLSADQKAKLVSIKAELEKKMAPVALHFAEVTNRVYENMLSNAPDEKVRVQLSAEMAGDAASLLAAKGESIFAAVQLLTVEQKALLRAEIKKPGAPADLTELIDKVLNR